MANNLNSKKQLSFSIADLTLKIKEGCSLPDGIKFELPETLKGFESDKKADAVYNIYYGKLPEFNLEKKLFESGGLWKLYKSNGSYIVNLASPVVDKEPYQRAVLSDDFTSGDIFINKNSQKGNSLISYPLRYPLDELLVISLLSRGRGIKVHGCGLIDNEAGILFLGVSGSGKSTMARIWKNIPKVTLLSDESLIIRKVDDCFWVYGTPWHGDANAVSCKKAPLKQIFFIYHSPENFLKPLNTQEALSRLLVRCFPTFWDAKGMNFILKIGQELCSEVSVSELGFVPNKAIVDFTRRYLYKYKKGD